MKIKILIIIIGLLNLVLALIVFGELAYRSFEGSIVVEIAVLFLSVLLIVNLFLLKNVEPILSSPLTFLSSKTIINMDDPDGNLAKVFKTQIFKVNTSGVRVIIDHGLWADGDILIKKAECEDLRVKVAPEKIRRGDNDELRFTFLDTPIRGHTYSRRIEMVFLDSFRKDEESFSLRITRKTKSLSIIINAHRDRLFQEAWLDFVEESMVVKRKKIGNLRLEDVDGKKAKLCYEITKPKIGTVHRLCWRWKK